MDRTLKESIDSVHRAIADLSEKIIGSLIQSRAFSSNDVKELIIFTTQLRSLLPEESVPEWLPEILNFKGSELNVQYKNNRADDFSNFLLSNLNRIKAPILTPDEVNYDFDLAFEKVREAADIPDTFDKLVGKLEEIIAMDVIDNRVVQQAIERLIALLNRNKHGSLTSILVSMHYGRFALKALGEFYLLTSMSNRW